MSGELMKIRQEEGLEGCSLRQGSQGGFLEKASLKWSSYREREEPSNTSHSRAQRQ